MTHWSLSNVLFNFHLFACFLLLFLLLGSSFNAFNADRMHRIISIFLYLLRLALCLKLWSMWRRFHGLLRKMYIVRKLNEIFCRHQVGPFDLWCDLVLEFLYWLFVWMTYLLVMGGIKVSYRHCVGVYICFSVLQSMVDETGCIDVGYILVDNGHFLWCISPFIRKNCPSLSCLINVSFKSSLSEKSIATPACFGGSLACKSSSSLWP
jgi:hypothetical protein